MGPGADPIEALPRALTTDEVAIIERSNGFGFDLLGRLASSDARDNLFLSPLSASMALGMTLNGASGDTWDAMRVTLGFDGMDATAINEAYAGLLALLQDLDPHVTFEVANAIWANESAPFHQSFFDVVTAAFDARVASADFGDPATLEAVNAWVDEHTDGKIEKMLDVLDPDLVMLLLNAMFFDGTWTTQFDPSDTRPAPFTRPDGSEVTVQMMEMSDAPVLRANGDGFQAVELPYGGGAFTMVIALPDDGDARALAGRLDAEAWSTLTGAFAESELDLLAVPKLRVTYDGFLNDVLADMGMEVAFGPAADFSAMSPLGDDFCISFVRQKTFLEVDEVGTRAAAATAVGIGAVSFNGFVVDRPFLLVIRERLSGTVLFQGLFEDPTAAATPPESPTPRCM